MPCRRHSSAAEVPASCSFRMPTICSSVNLLLRIDPPRRIFREDQSVPLEDQLKVLLSRLEPRADEIATLIGSGYQADFFCGLSLKSWNRGTSITAETLGRIAGL